MQGSSARLVLPVLNKELKLNGNAVFTVTNGVVAAETTTYGSAAMLTGTMVNAGINVDDGMLGIYMADAAQQKGTGQPAVENGEQTAPNFRGGAQPGSWKPGK